jgi:hypothetical protein
VTTTQIEDVVYNKTDSREVYMTTTQIDVVYNKTDSKEVHMITAQIEDTATYLSKIVTKQQGGKQHCTRNIP